MSNPLDFLRIMWYTIPQKMEYRQVKLSEKVCIHCRRSKTLRRMVFRAGTDSGCVSGEGWFYISCRRCKASGYRALNLSGKRTEQIFP